MELLGHIRRIRAMELLVWVSREIGHAVSLFWTQIKLHQEKAEQTRDSPNVGPKHPSQEDYDGPYIPITEKTY